MMRFSKLNIRKVPSNMMPTTMPLRRYLATSWIRPPRDEIGEGVLVFFFMICVNYNCSLVDDHKININPSVGMANRYEIDQNGIEGESDQCRGECESINANNNPLSAPRFSHCE